MDLGKIKLTEAKLNVLHPVTGLETGLILGVVSDSDPRVTKVRHAYTNQRLAKQKPKMTAEQLEHFNTEILAASVVSITWTGDASWNGEQLKYTPENVKKLLEADWLKAQVAELKEDNAGFFTA